ncbi:MAG: ABC transporter substrate-binding protein [Pseudomonadota bacterium]
MFSHQRISGIRRKLIIGAGLASVLVGASPLALAAEDAFAVGFVPADMTSLAPRLAEVAGTYAAYNIKPTLVTIEGGSRGLQVLLSGKLQGMQVGFSVVVNANREGADVRLVTASSNSMVMDIYANPTVKSPADLKGQKVAISAFTSETDMAVNLALRQWKMTRKDVTVTPLGGASQRIAAQLSGQVMAAPYVSPATATAREKGLVKILDLGNDGAPWVFNGLVVAKDFAKSNPDLIKRFIKANVEGVYKALADEKWAKEVIAKEFKTDSKAIIDDTYAQFKKFYAKDFTPAPAAVTNVIAEVNTMGPPLSSTKVEDYVDLGPIEALRKEGFFEAMKKKYGV